MKKILVVSYAVMFGFALQAQNVNIPDSGLKQTLLEHGASITGAGIGIIDSNADGDIQVSEALAYTGKVQVGVGSPTVWDHTGLEAFVNATNLYVLNTQGTSLNISSCISLTTLYVQTNMLTSLTLPTGIALEDLSILGFSLPTNVDVSTYTNLTNLMIRFASITQLDASTLTNLETLDCKGNELTSLTLPITSTLTVLSCEENNLTNVDVSQTTGLEFISCRENQLSALDVSGLPQLYILDCTDNDLTELNVANGNNSSFAAFGAAQNVNLTCIQVDSVAYSASNWSNIDAGASFSLNCGVGLDEIYSETTLKVFPNPASNQLMIESYQPITMVQIYTALGRLVKTETLSSIDITDLPQGTYLLRVEDATGFRNVSFVKR